MKRITIGLMQGMTAAVSGNEVIIDIPDECKRDLWLAQLNIWLEEVNETTAKVTNDGWLRVELNNKLSYTRRK